MANRLRTLVHFVPALAAGAVILACADEASLAQGRGNRDYGPIQWGDWLVTPTVNFGAIYNDNVFSSATDKIGRLGTTFGGSAYASRVDGLSQTQVYINGRADIYPSETKANAYTGAIGATHAREFGQDLLFNGGLEIARIQNSLQAQTLNANNVFDLSNTNYTQFQTQASLKKTFNRFFLEGGGSFVTQFYDENNPQTGNLNGWSARARVRAGYQVAPLVSVFVEPSVNWQRYDNSFYDTDGYQIVGGLSFPRLSLFTGEVYAGYMWQRYPNAGGETQGAPTVGGSVSWLPTPDITVTLGVTQSFGINGPTQGTPFSVLNSIPGASPAGDALVSVVPATANPTATANGQATRLSNNLIGLVSGASTPQQLLSSNGSGTKTTVVTLGGTYAATQAMSLGTTFAWQNQSASATLATSPNSDVYMARANVDYSLTANWGISATYAFSRVLYDTPGLSYSQNVVTLGVNGRL
ncbi:outer membrane beta-barrel protein [Alsobacter sp. R-9]